MQTGNQVESTLLLHTKMYPTVNIQVDLKLQEVVYHIILT